VQPQALLDCLALRGAADRHEIALQALELCAGVAATTSAAHFRRVRNLARYLRDFEPPQIAEHLRLVARLQDHGPVVVSVRATDDPDALDVNVAGVDLMGVSACVTGCLAEMGLSILQMDVVTYEPADDDAADEAAAPAAGRYVMSLRVGEGPQRREAEDLSASLAGRLKAAYWHLARGDVQRARQETADPDELVGQVLEGRYRLDRFLNRGGMGAIYLATQLDLHRLVAVKLLREQYTADEEFVSAFQREARLLANVPSAHVVHVYAAGTFRQRCWMALEYLSGGDLAHWTRRHGTPPWSLAARWLRDALEGLSALHHAAGVVHGDIKPANLLLDAAQRVKIGDLGLSRLHVLSRVLGTDGTVRGTPWYLSPEQARGETCDRRSDLFSLGSSLYHLLSGAPPFDAATPVEVLAKAARGEHASLSRAAPDVPAPLAVIVERLMQPDPLRRYQDAKVARADLESYLQADDWAAAPHRREAVLEGESTHTKLQKKDTR
jgi:hypothetical protein